jgi:long-subunit acyl-CoA synthetase (AMP-forming)
MELKRWADENNIEFPSDSASDAEFDAFCNNEPVISLITQELKRFEIEINNYERVRAWTFIKPLTPENDLLTQKMSLKRHNIAKVYENTIDGLYSKQLGNAVQRD